MSNYNIFPEVKYSLIRSNGLVTKRFDLTKEGLNKTGSPPGIKGDVETRYIPLNELILNQDPMVCHTYGLVSPDIGHKSPIAPKAFSGGEVKARTKEYFSFHDGPGVLFLDNDPNPDAVPPVAAYAPDDLISHLQKHVPGIGPDVAYVSAHSSGAGEIIDAATGEILRVSHGVHVYMAVDDAREIPRIGEIIRKRLWLAGHGSIALAKNGSMLVRCPIDGSVFSPERIDFTCPAILGPGLERKPLDDLAKRPGAAIRSKEVLDLTAKEEETYAALVTQAKAKARPRSDEIKGQFVGATTDKLVRNGVDSQIAKETALRACGEDGIDLYGDYLLRFGRINHPVSVSEVLGHPEQYDGKSLADPIDGPGEGLTKAMFYANEGYKPFINSFAHGTTKYFLHQKQPEILFADFISGHDDEMANDDKEDGEGDEVGSQKVLVSARKAAINGESQSKALRRIQKQWSSIPRSQAQEIVQKAYQWRERFASGQTTEDRGVTKKITDLVSLNARFSLLQANGQSTCVVHVSDSLLITWQDFNNRVMSEVVLVGVNAKGMPVFRSAYDFWRESCEKRTFTKVVFTSKKTPHMNLFNGFGVEPDASKSCQLILQHITEVICASDRAATEAMLNLIAWQIQNIGKPSRTIVSLYSEEQQVGKGVLLENLLLPIYGLSGFMTSDKESCLGRFNDALRGTSFLFLDEAAYAKDRRLADRLKGLAVASTMPIESKGVPVITMPSGLNIWMATNHKEVASVETHDLRYWVLEVSSHRRGDHEYFAALAQEIENGGKEAFLAMMLARDVSAFVPQRDIPRDNALMASVKAHSRSQRDATRWLAECIDAGLIVGLCRDAFGSISTNHEIWMPWETRAEMGGHELLEAYRNRWALNLPVGAYEAITPVNEFWALLSSVDILPGKKGGNRRRVLPDLETCKALLEKVISGEIRINGQ